ncbi:MAG TPA: DUF1501 domain-containing protein [Pyrinomonadaceae bacterium]|nr:DUF1501 domain-containing protein [Pyrinomonadaceae bacterium]
MKQTRRDFLRNTGCGLTMAAFAAQSNYFGLLNTLAQKADVQPGAAPPSDYRALVCIFLMGGNDGNNTIVPNHNDASVSGYAAYSAGRAAQGLALSQASLLPITVPRIGNLTYGLHPGFGTGGTNPGLHPLWAAGKMAAITNVGTLVQPLTRQQYINRSAPIPMNLFSHTDQSNQQENARADMVVLSGWGGRMSDRMTLPTNPTGLIPTLSTLVGTRLFTVGETSQPMSLGPAPAPLNTILSLTGYPNTPAANARLDALTGSLDLDQAHDIIRPANEVQREAIRISRSLNTGTEVTVAFPNTDLGNQLKQIARLIKARTGTQVNRQIFFCSLGGFDTHSGEITEQANLFSQFSQASRAFYDEMTAQGISDKVTQFTLSDFSRTFAPTGIGSNVGSDHGWASHAFVIGDSVIGGDFYGINTSNGTPFQTLVSNGPDDADTSNPRGRWIPTTSVEQYAATLASWFGLPEADMGYVFPNISNFQTRNLGFMQP